MSIFVSVVSYCDAVLKFTLERARSQAKNPESLHFGVVDQSPASSPCISAVELAPARLSYLRMDPVHARGPCWARAIAMSYYDGEDWFFQIDSHMDFDQDWDDHLISWAQRLTRGHTGVAITAYPQPFVFREDIPVPNPTPGAVMAHALRRDCAFASDHSVLKFSAHAVVTDRPIPGFHVGAGCLFTRGDFANRIPYDPHFYFHGEEQGVAIRLFTQGWDIYHVPAMPVYHLYNNVQSGHTRTLHWDAAEDEKRSIKWGELERRSRARLGRLLAGEDLGVYSLGNVRNLEDFARYCGIDYPNRILGEQSFRPLDALLLEETDAS